MFSANGLTVTMRIFASAQECCAALASGCWTICIASSEPSQAGSSLLEHKLAIVAAEPQPSKAFLQAAPQAQGNAAQHGQPALGLSEARPCVVFVSNAMSESIELLMPCADQHMACEQWYLVLNKYSAYILGVKKWCNYTGLLCSGTRQAASSSSLGAHPSPLHCRHRCSTCSP